MCEHCPVCDLKAAHGFCFCDTIYTGSCPAGAEWAGKHQQIFHPKAQEKNANVLGADNVVFSSSC